MNKKMVVGLLSTISSADSLIEKLEENGVLTQNISIVTRRDIVEGSVDIENDIISGVKEAAKKGGVIGGVLGLLVGVGALTIPGLGALFISGPLLAALGVTGVAGATASGAITGALAGGLVGALKEIGIDETTAKYIESKLKDGYILVATIVAEGNEEQVSDIYKDHNADSVVTVDVVEKE
jgi:uncharacterized membrane protein